MFDYFRKALKEAKAQKEIDKQKNRLMDLDPDYAYLEKILQSVCDTMLPDDETLHIQITTPKGYKYDISKSKKKQKTDEINIEPELEQWRVR